jgi:RHS repeat-associated protein
VFACNRLTLVTFKNSSHTTTKKVAYEYDAFDRRVRKRVDDNGNGTWDRGEQYVYDGAHIVMVFDDSGDLIRRNLFGPAIDQILASEFIGSPNDTHWYFADHLGTVRDVYSFDDVLNDLVSEGHIEYDSFGNIVDGAAVAEEARFAYTGREWDADAELYYYRARWYDPVLGKFISPDPIGLGPDYNARRYVENQPTMLTDPSGLAPNWRMPDADGNYAYPARFNYWDGVSTGQSPYKDRKDDPTAFQLFGVWHTAHTEIKSIPRVKIGQKPPGFKEYVTKNIDLGNRKTPCEDARSSIRTNLMHFKVMLVNHIAGVLLVQKQLSPSEKEEIANLIADWYILAVDKFLEEHWGAAPSQGTRNLIADRIGLQDDKNHPWCADWAQELVSQSSSLQDKRVMAGGVEVGITSLIRIDGFQYQTTFYQHNYLGMWTYGTATDPPSKNPNFLIFDPWINLRPQTYTNQVHPAPPTSQTLK